MSTPPSKIDGRVETAPANHDEIVRELSRLGFQARDTGAVRLAPRPNRSSVVFVTRRPSGAYVLSYPGSVTYRQVYKSWARTVAQLHAAGALMILCPVCADGACETKGKECGK